MLGWSLPAMYISESTEPLINKLCYLPAQLLATYLLIYYQIPRFIFTRKYVHFLGSFVVIAYVATVIARIFKIYVYETVLGADLPKDSLWDILIQIRPLLGQYFLWVYFVPIITLIIKFIKDHFEEKRQMEVLLKEKATAELRFLKAQIHPHFLFNTLNNLYTLTLRKSDLAPNIVRKLSDIMAYLFYQCKEPIVQISKEIDLIQSYIDLELLRYGDRLDLVFDHKIENSNAEIAPLILLSIVENAFKHGASGDMEKPQVHIYLKEENSQLQFRVFNTKASLAQTDNTDYKKGIGVSNVKRQLELIYPNHYKLETIRKERSYEVRLSIDLYPLETLQLVQ